MRRKWPAPRDLPVGGLRDLSITGAPGHRESSQVISSGSRFQRGGRPGFVV